MKPKSPLGVNTQPIANPNNLSRMDSSRLINLGDYAMDNVRHDLEIKLRDSRALILSVYKEIKESCVDEICKIYGKNPLQYLENEKKPDLDDLGKGLRMLVERVIKYAKSVSEPVQRMEEKLLFDPQERLEFLERELKATKLENDKAKLLIDTAYFKIDDLEKKRQDLLNENRKLKQKFGADVERLNNKLSIKTDMLKFTQEDNILNGSRPATSKNISRDFFSPRTNDTDIDPIKLISARMATTKMVNTEKTKQLFEVRRQNAHEADMELQQRQKDTLIARLKVQVEERDRDLKIMKKELDRVYADLKQMKEVELSREKKEWREEILSDKNPNTVKHYEDRFEEKVKENFQLKKQLRKFAINDKKVNIKEKAFEYERAEYQDKLTYLQERVNKLLRINEQYQKADIHNLTNNYAITNMMASSEPAHDTKHDGSSSSLAAKNSKKLETGKTLKPSSYGKHN